MPVRARRFIEENNFKIEQQKEPIMKALINKTNVLHVLVCTAILVIGPIAWCADTNFNGNVGIKSNLVVGGTVTVTNNATFISNLAVNGSFSVTNIVPNQANGSLSIFGANSD